MRKSSDLLDVYTEETNPTLIFNNDLEISPYFYTCGTLMIDKGSVMSWQANMLLYASDIRIKRFPLSSHEYDSFMFWFQNVNVIDCLDFFPDDQT